MITLITLLMNILTFLFIIGCIQSIKISARNLKNLPQNSDCPAGLGGKFCLDINCMSGNPCYNNGKCLKGDPNDYCSCEAGWAGPQCGLPSCEKVKCPVDIFCEEVKGIAICVCNIQDSKGKSHKIVGCTEKYRHNKGICAYNSTGSEICFCDEDYFGHNCEYQPCENPNYCENDGKCQSFNGDMECNCPHDTEGKHCKKCNLNCVHGKCIFDVNKDNFFCQCQSGFTSQLCDVEVPVVETNCSKIQCNGNGYCVNDGGNECNCLIEYTGYKCQYKCSEVCDSKKCKFENGKSVCFKQFTSEVTSYSQPITDHGVANNAPINVGLSVGLGVGIFLILVVIACVLIGVLIYKRRLTLRQVASFHKN